MKRLLAVVLIASLALCFFTSCAQRKITNDPQWRLIVLNQEVPDVCIKIISNDVAIPLTPVLFAYGYAIEWENDTKALVTKEDKSFILDLSTKEMFRTDNGLEILNNCDGAPVIREVSGKEIWVDRASIGVLLRFMTEKDISDIDYKTHVVMFGCRE